MRKQALIYVLMMTILLLLSMVMMVNGGSEAYAWPNVPLTFVPTPTPHAGPAFVKPGSTGLGCTQSNPCGSIQYAIDYSHPGYGDVIYIAGGTYTNTGEAVITVTKSITLYGGWDGSPTGPVVRDPEQYPTVLDGEGERRVVLLYNAITATLDGLTIIRGNATGATLNAGDGGGIYSWSGATPIIANSTISGNVATTTGLGNGGGICVVAPSGTAVITGNRVLSNIAALADTGTGGGIYLRDAPNAQVVNNEVISNTATVSSTRGYGGGIAVGGSRQGATLSGNRIEGNVALARSNGYGQGYGGGVDISAPATRLTGNDILSNTATITGGLGYGGGVRLAAGDAITVTDNRIEHNIAQLHPTTAGSSDGGGLYCSTDWNVSIRDNIIRDNAASATGRGRGGGIALNWHCDQATIAGNLVADNVGSGGYDYGYGGGIYVYASRDLRVQGNRILSNTASALFRGFGGGLHLERDVSITMTNNIVAANHASDQGGGMSLEGWSTGPITGTLAHNTFAANDRGSGEGRVGIYLRTSPVTLILTNNLIVSHTYGVYAASGTTATLYNTLFYAHSDSNTGGSGAITNTNPVTGQDPLLDGDYHLRPGSPAIDAGAPIPWITTDIDGDNRPFGPAPDIGADEFGLFEIYLPLVLRES